MASTQRTIFIAVSLVLLAAAPPDAPRELPGLHNVHKASDLVFLGSEPEGEEAFASLKELGITAIVSVDGAAPDVETAKQFGMRYIHIPIGYDGIPDKAARSLTRVAREVHLPVYIHCHHGKHRGPAAAAMLCIAAGSLSNAQAVALMDRAGTDKDYLGLWRDVKDFVPPGKDAKLPELVETAEVESMAAGMARLNRSIENLALCAEADWKPPADHPDLVPAADALIVREGFVEIRRQLKSEYDQEFRTWLLESNSLSQRLYDEIKAGNSQASTATLKSLEKTCTQCHAEYRN